MADYTKNAEFKFRGPLHTTREVVECTTTTSEMVAFIDRVYNGYARLTNTEAGEEVLPEGTDLIKGYTKIFQSTKKFSPIVLMLPVSFLDDRFLPDNMKSRKRKANEFQPKGIFLGDSETIGKGKSGNAVKLKPDVWRFLKSYIYDPSDIYDREGHPEFRSLSQRDLEECKRLITCRTKYYKQLGGHAVIVMIDIVKLFHSAGVDMNNPDEDFILEINGTKTNMASGTLNNYRYTMNRIVQKQGNNKRGKRTDTDIEAALLNSMRR